MMNRAHSLYQTQNMSQYTGELLWRKKQDAAEQLRNQQ